MKKIKITWKDDHWEVDPLHVTIPYADRAVEFAIHFGGSTKAGVRLDFSNPDVFGVPFLEFQCEKVHKVAVVGRVGDTCNGDPQELKTRYAKRRKMRDIFDVTIGN